MIMSSKHGDKVLIAQPVYEFNPTTGVQVVNKPIDVVVADNTDVIKKPVVADNDDVVKKPVVADKVSAVVDKAPVAADKVLVVVDKASIVADKHKADVVKPSNVVTDKSINLVVADNADVGKEPVKDKIKAPVKDKVEVSILKGSLSIDVVSNNVQDDPANVVNENLLAVDKPKNNVPEVVKEMHKTELPKDKPKNNALEVVKERRKIELPKDKPKNNVAEVVKDKSKPHPKQKIEDSDSELEMDEVVSSFDEVDHKPKKLKLKGGLKRKRNGSNSSSSFNEEKNRRLVNKLKKVKKEEFDEESVLKKSKKKEKQLTLDEAAHELCLSIFVTLRIRTSLSSLFSAIRDSRVDMLNFLSEIRFSSLHNVTIDKIPSTVGRFVVANFNEQTYFLSLDSGDKIEVTHRKIHEILGVPVDATSIDLKLLSLYKV
ncbi:hypothetical protein Tco_0641704 [Tanacetum coccineum]